MRTASNIVLADRSGKKPRPGRGFTLAELLVVTGVIALSLGIILPSIHGMFTARSDRQAEAALGGLLSAARGAAIENQTYGLLHHQVGVDGECWAGVFKYDVGSGKFVPVESIRPQQILGHMAFGEVSDAYVSGSNYLAAVNADLAGFTTFNVIFASDGSLVSDVNGAAPELDEGHVIFSGTGKDQVWDPDAAAVNEMGVKVMTVFDYRAAKMRADKAVYLNGVGRFLCVNPYTGQLIKIE